jgi:hypothetical protein
VTCRLSRGMVALLAVVALGPGPLPAGAVSVTTSCGTLSRVKTRIDRPAAPMIASSSAYADVGNSSLSFTIGGSGKSCVIVTYAGRMRAVTPEALWMRAVMDGSKIGEPGEVVMTADDGGAGSYAAHSFTWLFPSVSPGGHVVKFQFRTELGSPAGIFQHTVVVQYR